MCIYIYIYIYYTDLLHFAIGGTASWQRQCESMHLKQNAIVNVCRTFHARRLYRTIQADNRSNGDDVEWPHCCCCPLNDVQQRSVCQNLTRGAIAGLTATGRPLGSAPKPRPRMGRDTPRIIARSIGCKQVNDRIILWLLQITDLWARDRLNIYDVDVIIHVLTQQKHSLDRHLYNRTISTSC